MNIGCRALACVENWVCSCKYWLTCVAAIEPPPTAEATRLTER